MRDLLFDPEPYDPTAISVTRSSVTITLQCPESALRRVWTSVYDIPSGTLVKPSMESPLLLYITRFRMGWWFDRNKTSWNRDDFDIADRKGWSLGTVDCGPFTEVARVVRL